MATLTANELAHVRASTGDTDSNDYYNTDTELNYLYQNKFNSDGEQSVDTCVVWALRYMVAKAFRKVGRSNNVSGEAVQNQQEWEHLKAMLAYWEDITGEYAQVGTGSIDLGIDADEDLLSSE